MEFTFLGTSAGEQYPGAWCKCENCEKARRLGGRNIRKNSCAWLAPDCLIDFPGDIFMQLHSINLPADLAPGLYRISIGLYSSATGQRLPIADSRTPRGDRLMLQTVTVVPPK